MRACQLGLLLWMGIAACTSPEPQPQSDTESASEVSDTNSYTPTGPVRDSQSALRIGEQVLVARYGRATIDSQKPLSASLRNDIWLVTGTLPSGTVGGVGEVEISSTDGRILRVSHGL